MPGEFAFEGSAPGTRRSSYFIVHMFLYRLATHETLGGLNGNKYKSRCPAQGDDLTRSDMRKRGEVKPVLKQKAPCSFTQPSGASGRDFAYSFLRFCLAADPLRFGSEVLSRRHPKDFHLHVTPRFAFAPRLLRAAPWLAWRTKQRRPAESRAS